MFANILLFLAIVGCGVRLLGITKLPNLPSEDTVTVPAATAAAATAATAVTVSVSMAMAMAVLHHQQQ